jgi:colicin import membrane protein
MRGVATQRASDRWVSITLSVLLHGALAAALVYGWLLFRRPPRPAPTLAIEATVVDERAARGALHPPSPQPTAPAPAPAEPPQEAVGPPQPTPDELTQREQERQQAEAAAAEQRRVAAEKAAAEEAARAAAEQREAEARAAAERKAREAAEAQKRAEEQKRAAEEQRQRQAEERDNSEREEDLKRSLAAEEQGRATRNSSARASWVSQIAARINRAWLRPPTAQPGIECTLEVTQVPGGTVTKVSIGECNGDQAVRESIEAAVYRASPLPPPPDPSMFDPVLHINFKPD